MKDWLDNLWDNLTAVSLPLLILGLAFQTAQTLLVALAWRNILRAAYPAAGVKYRPIPAITRAATAERDPAGVRRHRRHARPVPDDHRGCDGGGLVGATFVENIFFVIIAALIYAWLFLSAAGRSTSTWLVRRPLGCSTL